MQVNVNRCHISSRESKIKQTFVNLCVCFIVIYKTQITHRTYFKSTRNVWSFTHTVIQNLIKVISPKVFFYFPEFPQSKVSCNDYCAWNVHQFF